MLGCEGSFGEEKISEQKKKLLLFEGAGARATWKSTRGPLERESHPIGWAGKPLFPTDGFAFKQRHAVMKAWPGCEYARYKMVR